MDEVKPVAWAFAQDWTKFQADRRECRLLPNFYYGEDMSLSSGFAPLYDQQAIDTVRAEVEQLNSEFLDLQREMNLWQDEALSLRKLCLEAVGRVSVLPDGGDLHDRLVAATVKDEW